MIDRGAIASGLFFVLTGLLLLLDGLDVWELSGGVLLPAMLVIGGVSTLIAGLVGRS